MRSAIAIVATLLPLVAASYPFYPLQQGLLAPFSFTRHLSNALHHGVGSMKMAAPPTPPSTARFFNQLLDHFSADDSTTFQQMYFINSAYVAKDTSPLFVHLILPQEVAYSSDPTLYDNIAKKFGALSVTVEHRYYGNSIPFKSMATSNLRYFTVEQAMEDFVNFRLFIQTNYNISDDIPWLLDGCSYSGAVSAWMKASYPNLFFGSIAGSSVIEARIDFSQYVVEMGKQLPSDCYQYLYDARTAIESKITTLSGRQEIVQAFDVCVDPLDPGVTDPLVEPTNRFLFDAFLFNQVSSIVQYGNSKSIDAMCNEIMTNKSSPLTGFGNYMATYALQKPAQPCLFTNYKKAIPYIQTQMLNDLAFGWQQCTQLGYMQTTEGADSVLPTYFNLTGYLRFCGDVFNTANLTLPFSATDSTLDLVPLPRARRFNAAHGSHSIQLTNTLFLNGGIDPYHFLSNYEESQLVGLSAQEDSLNGVLFYPDYSHCRYAPNATDLTYEYIQKWLTASKPTKN